MDAAAVLAVSRRLYEFARCIDTEDWNGFAELFTDEVHLDYTSFDPSRSAGPVPRDGWVARLRPKFAALHSSQHVMTNPVVDLDEASDAAEVSMYVQAHHFGPAVADGPGERFTIGGCYTDGLRRVDGTWRIERVKLEVYWRTGSPALMQQFFEGPAEAG